MLMMHAERRARRWNTQATPKSDLEIARVPVATGDESMSFFINNKGELAALWQTGKGINRLAEERHLINKSALAGVKFVSVTSATDQKSQFVALVSDSGQVYTWGSGAWGRLGHGNTDDNDIPMAIGAGLNGHRVVAVAADNHCLAVTDSGKVFSWGLNEFGQCGHPPRHENILQPREIRRRGLGVKWRNASVGHSHSLLVSTCGKLYAFGSNFQGMLGDGSFTDCADPTAVILHGNCIASAAGMTHSLAVTDDGRVFAWGLDHMGELGVVVPCKRVDIHRVFSQAGTHTHPNGHIPVGEPIYYANSQLPAVLNLAQSTPYIGYVPSGDIPVGLVDLTQPINRTFTQTPDLCVFTVPRQVPHLHNVISVSAFENASCAVTRDGKLFTWGTRSRVTLNIPTHVPLSGRVVSVSISTRNNIAVMSDGRVFQWFERGIAFGHGEIRRQREQHIIEDSIPKQIYTFTPHPSN